MALSTVEITLKPLRFPAGKAGSQLPKAVDGLPTPRIKARNLPVLAFSRKGDPDTGDFADAEVIASFNVPSEFTGEGADW